MNALLLALWAGAATAATPVWSTTLQADDGGLVPSGDPDQWEWGRVESGPGEGWDGTHAWATRLDAVHMNDAEDFLTLPEVDLRGADRPVLVLHHWYELEPDGDDLGQVEAFDGISWLPIAPVQGSAPFVGSSGGWQTDYFDLTGHAQLSDLRLRFQADTSVARAGWYVGGLEVLDGDPVPPVVEIVDSPVDTQDLSGPYPIALTARDDVGVEAVYIEWYTGEEAGTIATLETDGAGRWTGELAGVPPGTTYVWWAVATDAAGNEAYASGPSFRVYLPAPTDLSAPEGRVVAATVPLSWTAPESIWPILNHHVYRNGQLVAVTGSTTVEAPVSGPDDRFTVAASFQTSLGAFHGDESDPIWVDAHPPTITRFSPAGGWPGDQLRIELEGRYLLLESGDATVDLGPGVQIDSVEVVDVDRLRAIVTLAEEASPGTRDLVVRTMGQDVVAAGAFEVRSGDSRPRVTALSPARLVQGSRASLTLRANVALSAEAQVDFGPGVVVESVTVDGERGLQLQLAVARDAPVGERRVEADIGTRILTGASDLLRVVPPQPSPQTLCGLSAPSQGAMWVGVLLVALARRRELPQHGG